MIDLCKMRNGFERKHQEQLVFLSCNKNQGYIDLVEKSNKFEGKLKER